MIEANGLDAEWHGHIREAMIELITITESFYACGVASSVYCTKDPAGSAMPDAVFSNIGKLLLASKIYDMHRLAHYVSGGLIVALPGPDEDHNPETRASLTAVMGGRPDIPAERRAEVARFIEDLTVSHQAGWYSVISLHGGGSPEAMKREIWRNYPVMEKSISSRSCSTAASSMRAAAFRNSRAGVARRDARCRNLWPIVPRTSPRSKGRRSSRRDDGVRPTRKPAGAALDVRRGGCILRDTARR